METVRETQEVAEQTTRYVLEIKLENEEELKADLDGDWAAAQAELKAVHAGLHSDSFVLLGQRAVVRSQEVRYVLLQEGESEHGLLETLKAKVGGERMSGYDEETQQAMPGPTMRGRPIRTHGGQGWSNQWVGYGRRPWAETKPFFLTSEFLTLVGSIVAVAIAMGVSEVFDGVRGWTLITVLAAAYMLSRGIAKAGTRDPNPTER